MRGFVTLAVGDIKYYRLAANLLKSYKLHTASPMPWAIYADCENEYTQLFDKVILIPDPCKSYMDKINMLDHPAWDENIFIDADCLAYGDLNRYWDYYEESGVRCIGRALPLDSNDGWFKIDGIGEYKERCAFIPQMHGGIIFFSNDALAHRIFSDAKVIAAEYDRFVFRYFKKPADEPILALSMAINDCKPIELSKKEKEKAFLFYPTAGKVRADIREGLCRYMRHDATWVSDCLLIHWQNKNTEKPLYRMEIDRLNGVSPGARLFRGFWYKTQNVIINAPARMKTMISASILRK